MDRIEETNEPVSVEKYGYVTTMFNHYLYFTPGKKYAVLDWLKADKHTDFKYDYILLKDDRNYTSFYSIENFKRINK